MNYKTRDIFQLGSLNCNITSVTISVFDIFGFNRHFDGHLGNVKSGKLESGFIVFFDLKNLQVDTKIFVEVE